MNTRLFSCFLGAVALLFAGCESSIKERIADAPPKVQEFDGTVERVYQAAQRAFKRVDFVIVRSSMGRIEAASAVHRSEVFANARQIVAKLRLREAEPGKVVAEMSLTEEVAGDSFGGTYRKPLPEHEFYSTYFAVLQQVLTERAGEN